MRTALLLFSLIIISCKSYEDAVLTLSFRADYVEDSGKLCVIGYKKIFPWDAMKLKEAIQTAEKVEPLKPVYGGVWDLDVRINHETTKLQLVGCTDEYTAIYNSSEQFKGIKTFGRNPKTYKIDNPEFWEIIEKYQKMIPKKCYCECDTTETQQVK